MGFWDFVRKTIDLVDTVAGGPQQREAQAKEYKNHSLSCNKCGGLAGPISGTKRNYRCPCGHQFSGPLHPY